MARRLMFDIAPTSRGVKLKLTVTDEGQVVLTKTSTRLWGRADAHKAPDDLLTRQAFGALAVALRDWMDQGELPF